MFIDQFRSLMVGLLAVAMVLALLMGDPLEAVAILVVIVLNALIGFATEWRADRALEALKRQIVVESHVVRGGVERKIPAAELVPGDVVVLAAGGRVPADGRLVESQRLQVIEAALTGESEPVLKRAEDVSERGAPLGDRLGMAFLSTVVADGRGRMVVTATGPRSEVGKIGRLIEEAGEEKTPLERKLQELGRTLVLIVLGLCVVITLVGIARGNEVLRMTEVGISLAIAAVPEGLQAVATMTLALGMQRMARMRALVRRLPAVEALGSTTVICTDKTGTLTKNEMTVQTYRLGDRRIDVTGSGYQRVGEFREGSGRIDSKRDEHLAMALRVGALCNDAKLEVSDDRMAVLGDPTEGALLVAAMKAGIDRSELESKYPRRDEIPFDSERKRMITSHVTPEGGRLVCLKGAPSAALEASAFEMVDGKVVALEPSRRDEILQGNRELASQALRVLGLTFRELESGDGAASDVERDHTFLGLVGMIDPLREEARDAIAVCREAGIRSVMITGDQELTAREIARQLELDRDVDGSALEVVHARELEGLDAAGWEQTVERAGVFARVSPEHKLRIVESFQRKGHVVAMTGDGVNDAPALKKAQIGVAMGIQGTEVAKETADMIITDDNFATIVGAVEQGRIIYANIQKFIHFLFSCNFAEVLTVFAAILIGWPLPLLPLHILWMNLVTDVFPAMALAVEPSEPGAMKRPPRPPDEPLLEPRFLGLVGWQGLLIAVLTLVGFGVGLAWYGHEGDGLRHAQTLAFMTLSLSQVFHAFNVRSRWGTIFGARLFRNGWLWAATFASLGLQTLAVSLPLLRNVLHTVPPTIADFVLVSALSLLPVVVVEVVKLAVRRYGPALKTEVS
jgi:Ca2+-transporting ATPase